MSQYYVHAIILEERPFREYDRIVSIFTRERGKMDVHAVGTRKIKSKLSAHLIPIKISELLVVDAKFLPKTISAISLKNFSALMNSREGIRFGGAILRLVHNFTREGVSDEEMYFLVSSALNGLQELICDSAPVSQLEKLFSAFFLSFVALLGYAPKKEQCFVCRKTIIAPEREEFLGEFSLCRTCLFQSQIHPATLQVDQDLYTLLFAASHP